MIKEEMVKYNLDLLNEFMKYAFEHPEVMEEIPAGAELVILPVNDSEMMRENKRTADQMAKAGKQVVLVKFRKPEFITPEMELLRS